MEIFVFTINPLYRQRNITIILLLVHNRGINLYLLLTSQLVYWTTPYSAALILQYYIFSVMPFCDAIGHTSKRSSKY